MDLDQKKSWNEYVPGNNLIFIKTPYLAKTYVVANALFRPREQYLVVP